jgi:hypothetical protein
MQAHRITCLDRAPSSGTVGEGELLGDGRRRDRQREEEQRKADCGMRKGAATACWHGHERSWARRVDHSVTGRIRCQ